MRARPHPGITLGGLPVEVAIATAVAVAVAFGAGAAGAAPPATPAPATPPRPSAPPATLTPSAPPAPGAPPATLTPSAPPVMLTPSAPPATLTPATPPAAPVSPPAAPAGRPEPRVLETVVTATRTPEDSQRATVRTTVVTREEAIKRGATSVGEALAGELGVQVNAGAYGTVGSPAGIQIQGFDRERVLILEDGERLVGDLGGVIDLASLPLADVGHIEIVAGPTSALYGTSALGGVVNILTQRPDRFGAAATTRLEWRSLRGMLFQGTGTQRWSRFWLAADANVNRSDGVRLDPELPDLAFPHARRYLASLRAGLMLPRRHEIRLRVRWIRDELDGRESEQVPGLGTYVVDLPQRGHRLKVHATSQLAIGKSSSLRLSAAQQWFLHDSAKVRVGSPLGEERYREAGLTSLEGTLTLADGPRTWVAGTRFEAEVFEQELERTEVVMEQPRAMRLQEVVPTSLSSIAFYGQLIWRLTRRLRLLAGARGEVHLRYGNVVAPRLALSYQPASRLQLRAGFGRGFRAPSAKEFGFVFDHSYFGYRVIGNPDLTPETSWGVNGDASLRLHRAVTVRAAGFANWVDQLIDVSVNPVLTAGGISEFSYRNVATARTAGAQADVIVRHGGWLSVQAGYAFLWTRDDTRDLPLPSRPAHTWLATVQLDRLPGRLGLYARWRHVSSAFIDPATRSPGYHTLDARVSRPLWARAQAYVGVLNALDALRDPRTPGDQRPVVGRQVYAGIRADFPWEDP